MEFALGVVTGLGVVYAAVGVFSFPGFKAETQCFKCAVVRALTWPVWLFVD